ncbi:MAG: sigma 54-interacting transcriptional regulator [Candidatus Rokubacteria bacterium]|nr:sigma 54-interacting transcriptional regulator [Candidatus Rokubacteria bacterium]
MDDAGTGLVGQSPALLGLKQQVGRLLEHQVPGSRLPPLLIQGETGTGKGLLARAIHAGSLRASEPFVDVDCAAIPETLLESELFGFERGAFTDARHAKAGLFQTAHRGTVLLDEVGLLTRPLQAKLLKVVEQRGVRRLGSTRSELVDVWIIAATNEDLARATHEGRFREDLYHRLAAVTLSLPPLRERGEDILLLAEHFLARACHEYGLTARTLAPDAREALLGYGWPGNVRELANLMERVILLSEGSAVTADRLGLPAGVPAGSAGGAGTRPDLLRASVDLFERDRLLSALGESGWNVSLAALRLGVPRNTLRYRIGRLRLRPPADAGAQGRPRPIRDVSSSSTSSTSSTAEPAASAKAPAARTPGPVSRPRRGSARRPAGGAAAAGGQGPASAPEWELRPVTMLGVVLSPAAGPSEPGLLAGAMEIVAEKTRAFGGRVESVEGATLVAAFGLRSAEHAALRALLAGLAIVKLGESAGADAGARVTVRIAAHTAEAMVRRDNGEARIGAQDGPGMEAVLGGLLEAAGPNSIVVSGAMAPLLSRHFRLEPAVAGGGEAAPGAAHRVLGRRQAGDPESGGLIPFVGRGRELDTLLDLVARAEAGRGQVVGVMGEPGIGKSRLLHELRRRLSACGIPVYEGRCAPGGRATLQSTMLELLRQAYGIGEGDDAEAVVGKVREGLGAKGLSAQEWAPSLLLLLGMSGGDGGLAALSPEARKARIFDSLRRLTVERSRRQPFVLALDDAHWLGKTSEEFLEFLVRGLPASRVLLLCTYRPDYRPAWLAAHSASQLALPPLERAESLAMLGSILPPARGEPLRERIIEQAQGNPLFLQQLAQAAGQSGPDEPGASIPQTIREVIVGRMDRLAEGPRRLLQCLSVFRGSVPLPVLAAVAGDTPELAERLDALERLDFAREEPGTEPPEYAVSHSLAREVVYQGLPLPEREALHAAAGQALEAHYGARRGGGCEQLAYHYARAGDPRKAIEHLTGFAEVLLGASGLSEAAETLSEALGHAQRLPGSQRDRSHVELLLRLTGVLAWLGQAGEARALLGTERERVERLHEPHLTGLYHCQLALAHSYLGEPEAARAAGRRAVDEAARCGDEPIIGRAQFVSAVADWALGQYRAAMENARHAVLCLTRVGDTHWLARSRRILGLARFGAGDFDGALEAVGAAEALGAASGDAWTQSIAASAAGWILATRGDGEAASAACQRALQCARDPFTRASAMGTLGLAFLERHDPAGAIPWLEGAVEQARRFTNRRVEGRFLVFRGQAYLGLGRLDEARRSVAAGLEMCRTTRFAYGTGLGERALGEVALAAGRLDEAATHLARARDLFTAVGSPHEVARGQVLHSNIGQGRTALQRGGGEGLSTVA